MALARTSLVITCATVHASGLVKTVKDMTPSSLEEFIAPLGNRGVAQPTLTLRLKRPNVLLMAARRKLGTENVIKNVTRMLVSLMATTAHLALTHGATALNLQGALKCLPTGDVIESATTQGVCSTVTTAGVCLSPAVHSTMLSARSDTPTESATSVVTPQNATGTAWTAKRSLPNWPMVPSLSS